MYVYIIYRSFVDRLEKDVGSIPSRKGPAGRKSRECVYIYIYIDVYIHMYICVCVYIYICVYI